MATLPSAARDDRPVILLLLSYFNSAVEANGPNQSLIGTIATLSDRYRFRVISNAVEGDEPGRWSTIFGIDRLPLKRLRMGAKGYRRALNETPHDLLVANSYFDRWFTISALLMRKFGLVRRTPMLLAPRGEFSPGALGLNPWRKRLYIVLTRLLGLLDGVAIQATSEREAELIRASLPFAAGPILQGPIVRDIAPLPEHRPRPPGAPLRVGFVGRISRMKNLDYALDVLATVRQPLVFNIFGPVEDVPHWEECSAKIASLPAHVTVRHHGEIPRAEVIGKLADQDILFHPTLGENYGHAIIDALVAGTPVLMSDRTPWQGLEAAGGGWIVPLDAPARFAALLETAAQMDEEELAAMRSRARAYVETTLDVEGAARQLAACFDTAMHRHGQGPLRQEAA